MKKKVVLSLIGALYLVMAVFSIWKVDIQKDIHWFYPEMIGILPIGVGLSILMIMGLNRFANWENQNAKLTIVLLAFLALAGFGCYLLAHAIGVEATIALVGTILLIIGFVLAMILLPNKTEKKKA